MRRLAHVQRATLAALVLMPLLLTGRELATRRIFAALDLAYMNEPLVSVADRAGVYEVSAPIASDVYAQFVPWYDAVRYSLAHHQWPLWNPFEFCGDILAPAVQSAPYHPLHIAGLLLPLPDALTFIAAMLLFLAASSMFLFVRPLVATDLAALTGAAAWMFAPHVARFAGTAYALSLATMPLVLLGARRLATRPTMRNAALLAFALVLTVFAGHPETLLHIVVVATAYFFVELDREQWQRAVTLAFAAGIASLLITAIAIVPFFDAMTQTEEYAHRVAGGQHAAPFVAAMESALAAVLPGGAVYLGSIALMLAAVALMRRRGSTEAFFTIVFVIGLLAGVRAPVVTHVLARIPIFSIAANEHLVWSAALAIAVLAAFGADAITPRKASIIAIPIAAAAFLTMDDSLALLRVIAPMILLIAALLVRSHRWATAIALALLLVQRGGETVSFRTSVPRRAFYPDFPGIELLRGDEPFRVVGQQSILTPNTATHYRLEDPRGYQAMTLGRYADLLTAWSRRTGTWSNVVSKLDSPLLSLMNVRYALSVPNEPLPDGWRTLGRFDGYNVAENLRVLPRAFVPARVHGGVTRSEAVDYVRGWTDFAGDAWIESGSRGVTDNGPGVVHVRTVGTRLDMNASMTNPGWIVVSQSAWRGWRATVDGVPTPVVPADAAFIAFHAPAGEHHIKLVFRPMSFEVGAMISASALLALAAAMTMSRRRWSRVRVVRETDQGAG